MEEAARERAGRRYGFWATLGLTVLALLGGVAGSYVVALGYAFGLLVTRPDVDPRVVGELLSGSGTVVSLTVVIGGAITIALVGLFARLRKGISLSEYLAWRWPGTGTVLLWIGAAFGYLILVELIGRLLGMDFGGDFMVDAFCAAWPPLIWIAFVLVAPLSEELLFRGFLLGGFAESRAGPVAAVLLSSLLWAMLHVQYELAAVVMLVGAGVLFGYARLRTGSVVTPLIMHAVWNGIAVAATTLEAMGPEGACG